MSSFRFHTRVVSAAALAVSVIVFPSAASAQLGKLKKAAADAVKEKAGIRPAEQSGSSSGSTNLVITADRLAAVMAVMEPVMQEAARQSAAREAQAAFNQQRKAFENCIEAQGKALGRGATPTSEGLTKAGTMAQQSVDLVQRATAAQSARRYREYVAINDSMVILGSLSTLAMFDLEGKCGKPVYKPAAILDAEAVSAARDASNQSSGGDDEIVVTPAQRAGMSHYQFGMIRERVALWALQQTNNAPVGNNKYGSFTPEEQGALEAQGAQLRKWASVLKDQPALWATWGNLQNW